MRHIVTDWQYRMFEGGEPMDMIRHVLVYYFKIGFLNFSIICGWYTLELPHNRQFQCAPTIYVHSIN